MGSRILSRSFQVEKWGSAELDDSVEDEEGQEHEQADVSMESAKNDAMDVDSESPAKVEAAVGQDEAPEEDDDDEPGDPSDVAMVPMADLLNARCNAGNVRFICCQSNEPHLISSRLNCSTKSRVSRWSLLGSSNQANKS